MFDTTEDSDSGSDATSGVCSVHSLPEEDGFGASASAAAAASASAALSSLAARMASALCKASVTTDGLESSMAFCTQSGEAGVDTGVDAGVDKGVALKVFSWTLTETSVDGALTEDEVVASSGGSWLLTKQTVKVDPCL